MLEHIDEISGAKRKQNLTEHADDARISKQLATVKRDIPIELDLESFVAVAPDRSALRDTFREYELREPLRRLEEALGSADAAAPAPAAEESLTARVRDGQVGDVAQLPETEVAVAVRPPDVPEDALFSADATWTFGVYADGGSQILTGPCERPPSVVAAARPAAGDRPRRQGAGRGAATCSPTTPRSPPTCSSPRAARIRSASCARSAAWPPPSRARPPPTRCWPTRWPQWQREQIRGRGLTDLLLEVELPLVRVLRDMEKSGLKLDTQRLREISDRVKDEAYQLEREIFDLCGTEFMLGSPRQLEEVLFGRSACRASAAARPATRPTPACCRRSAASTR